MGRKWPKRRFYWEEPMSDFAVNYREAEETDEPVKEPKIGITVTVRVTPTERSLRFHFGKPDLTDIWGF